MENKSTIFLTEKKAHIDQIISISNNKDDNYENLIATSSEDQTVRIWDLRTQSSIALLTDQSLKEFQLANTVFDKQQLYLAASNNIFMWDLRNPQTIQNEVMQKKNLKCDEINELIYDEQSKIMACCDDSGNSAIINPSTMEVEKTLGSQHSNISYSLCFLKQQSAPESPNLLTSGFDCQIILWNLMKKIPMKSINLIQVAQKYISGNLLCPPLIYSIDSNEKNFVAATETGHLFIFPSNSIKKVILLNFYYCDKKIQTPIAIIDGHFGKIIRAAYSKIEENSIISASNDLSFGIWKKQDKAKDFSELYKCARKPNWIESHKPNLIFIADMTPNLSIFQIKD